MPRHAALTVAVLAAALLSVAAPARAAAPEFTVTVATANGSGCPGATATAEVQPDDSSFTVDFDGYFAWAGGDAPATAFRRNCQFSFQISGPEGLTYAVDRADYSGFALLSAGVTGLQSTRYYFQGSSATAVASQTFTGPFADSWEVSNTFGPATRVYAPCGAERNLNVNTELRLRPLPATADLNILVLDPSLTLHLTWQACP